ncbi:MAG TPA: L-histidine N(alpha)-methyltransferase [Usitatibacter sp.]|nr:L-histidine N(alpha)-methyltransferase [Usitatibacter sp.]
MLDGKPDGSRVIDRLEGAGRDERAEVIASLLASPACIAPKYFYDELGCALYGAICHLPEYYPTRTEAALFAARRDEIAAAMGKARQFVDLGSSDSRKAQEWLPYVDPVRYIAVDIAVAEMERALARLAPDMPGIEMLGVATDFTRGLPLADVLDERPATFFYPGSSIGNFTPEEAVQFLGRIREHCAARPGSGLLIGVDGKKEKRRLDLAYDDPLGVTAAFNRNVLRHLNRRFGFDFPVEAFAHRGFYAEARGRIEMHLQALHDQSVKLGSAQREFKAGERIHTENSYKYHAGEFEALLGRAGFGDVRRWTSATDAYYVFYAS